MGASLDALFEFDEPVAEIVNIADETPKGLPMSARIRLWCQQSDRHVYIGRGSPWGNPYSHLAKSAAEYQVRTREEAIQCYREYILSRPDLLAKLNELRGKRLGCWCKPKDCHGDVLVELLWDLETGRNRIEDRYSNQSQK